MKAPVPSSRTVVVLTWVAVVGGLLLTVYLIGRVTTLSHDLGDTQDRATASAEDRADLRADVEEQGAALEEANRKLVELGEEPVEPPPVSAVPSSPLQGPAGPAGPVGPRGPQGDTGNEGDDGGAGPVGTAGADGATGPQGPPGPAGPAGPAGADGKDGAPGAAGRGIQSLACVGGQVVVTYTDDTTQSIDGWSCLPINPGNSGGNQ